MMKRIMAAFLSICICMSAIPMSVFAASPRQTILYGDTNDTGKVDFQDLALIERYIAGEKNLTIDDKNSDINADGIIDKTDADLLREYLVGNLDTLTPVLYEITFNTAGGDAIEPIMAGKGYTYKGEIPTPSKEDGLFTGWVKPDGKTYYKAEDVIASDITLTAVYSPVEAQQTLSITSFSLDDQPTDASFILKGSFSSAAEVKDKITVLAKDGSDPVAITATDGGDGTYTVSAPEGFHPGASYELTLKDDGLSFADKDDMFRTVYFIIKKAEADDLKYNPDVIFIKDTDEMKYTIGSTTTDVLESNLLSNDKSKEDVTGTFPMSGKSLAVGDIVCIYENVDPNDRDYTKNDYEEDALAYIRITSVNGTIYGFESLNEEDSEDVLAMPDTIPYSVDALPTTTGTVDKNDYDGHARAKLGKTEAPEFNVYDILVFYTGSYDELTKDSSGVYGQVTKVDGNTVSYKIVTKEDIENFSGMFVKQEIDGNDLLETIDREKVLNGIKQQAENSGFIEEAADYMAQSAFQTKDIQSALRKNGVSDEEIQVLAHTPAPLAAAGATGKKTRVIFEGITVLPTFIKGEHFKNGIGIGLEVTLYLSVDTKISAAKTSSLKIELTAGFEQELALSTDVSINDKWVWFLFIPVLKELGVNVAIDIQNYSFVSVGAKLYTVSNDIMKNAWKALTEGDLGRNAPPQVKNALRQINMLGAQAERLKKNAAAAKKLQEQIDGYKKQLPKVKVDNVEYSYEQLMETLGAEDVGTSFDEVFSAETETENKVGLEQLMNRYKETMNQESDWVEIFNQTIFEQEYNIRIVAIKLGVNFIIRGNANISIGADLEYQVGKRYNFWIHLSNYLKNADSGSSEFDLIDERFAFQFYVMGTLGLRIGVKVDVAVGLVSTKIASIGANVEFGPYLQIWGYFIYIYEELRPVDTSAWNVKEEMLGALYLEFGLYVKVNLKVQVFNNALKYEPTLYNGVFPLVTAGAKRNVYDFVLNSDKNDEAYVVDSDGDGTNGITMAVPERFQNMRTIDMVSGDKEQFTYPRDKYIYTVSDSRFIVDGNGIITVKPGVTDRYLKCDLRIVWKCDKAAFSKYDIDITVPLVWTNMSESELKEKFTASVKVGNSIDGYQTVWSERMSRIDTFDLPSEDEILKLINYDSYTADNGSNVKYSEVDGYRDGVKTGLKITSDTNYYFDVTQRKITLTVNGVQKTDGTTESHVFETTYGNPFDLSGLKETGTDNPEASEYTAFKNLTDADSKEFDMDTAANLSFAEKYGDNATVTANYQDEALTATYKFVGIGNVPPVTVKFKKGTIPYFAGLNDYVAEHGGEAAKMIGMTPASAPVASPITYTVTCVNDNDASLPKHLLRFNTNGGNLIKSQEYEEGSIIFRPDNPTRTGYYFGSWYSDSAFSKIFDFSATMPDSAITAYAKWTANSYTITLNSQGTKVDVPATYDQPYGSLTSPDKQTDYKFTGWYTEQSGGTLITADTVYTTAGDQTLYAHWEKKTVINGKQITLKPKAIVFNEKEQPATLSFDNTYEGPRDSFVIRYKRQTKPGEPVAEWTSKKPFDAGTYDVKFSRPNDDNYKELPEIVVGNAIQITKAPLTVTGLNAQRIGNTVYISHNTIKGDGKVYYLASAGTKTLMRDTRVISGLTGTSGIQYWVEIAEGTNYQAYKSSKSSAFTSETEMKSGNFTVEFLIKTEDNKMAGTSSPVFGAYLYPDGTQSAEKQLSKENNNFGAGHTALHPISDSVVPWQVAGYHLRKTGTNDWTMEWLGIQVSSSVVTLYVQDGNEDDNEDTYVHKFEGDEKLSHSWTISGDNFKRNIKDTDNFAGGADSIDLNEQANTYTYSYSGKVTDQFYKDGYNAFEYYAPPTFSVTSGIAAYDRFIRYTGVSSFTIDTQGLRTYMQRYGRKAFDYTVSLKFSTETTKNTTAYTKTIPVKPPDSAKSVQKSQASPVPVSIPHMAVPMMLSSLKSGGTATMSFTADEIAANRGTTFDLPVQLDGNQSLWGILAGIQFDTQVLKLTGCTAGDVFGEKQFTLQNDLSKAPYKFLATLNTIDTIEANGKLITLHFRVRDDAKDGNSTISIGLLEASDTAGVVSIEKGNNYNITVDSTAPVIVGGADGKTFCGETEFTITDANIDTITVNAKAVTVTNGKFTLSPTEGIQTIVLTDKAGNATTIKVTINKNHTWSNWKHDADGHWHECLIDGKTDTKTSHSGGAATCRTKAVCEVCKSEYGEIDPDNHDGKTEIRNAVPATENADGYTGDTYCLGCKQKITDGKMVAKLEPSHTHAAGTGWKSDDKNHWHICSCGKILDRSAHDFKWVTDKKATKTEKGLRHEECTICGYKKAAVEIPSDFPQTGDNSNIFLWICLLFISGGVLTTLVIAKKRK